MQTRLRLAKNAIANLVRGGSAGLAAVVLPAILARHMSQTNYAIWVLVLQVSAYSSYLDFGLQTAVGRSIAFCNERGDENRRDGLFSTAFAGLTIAALIALAALLFAAWMAGSLFPKVGADFLPEMRAALLIVGSSIALGLPSSAWSAVFVGIQRSELSAAVTGGAKLLSSIGLVLAALQGASLVTMAVVVASINLLSYLALYLLFRRYGNVGFHIALVNRSLARELFQYCFSLSIWSFATLLINGLDVVLVGRFELTALVPYALASSLTSMVAGLQSAVFNAMMPHAAVLHARGDSKGLGNLTLATSRLAVILLLLSSLPVMLYAQPLFRLWVGQQYAPAGRHLLLMLLAANVVRFTGLPYSIVLVASEQQRLVTLSPLLEGFSNLLASLYLGARFGAIGVAAGTLIGGVVGMLGHILYNMPRTRTHVLFSTRRFLVSSVLLPALTATPLLLLLLHTQQLAPSLKSLTLVSLSTLAMAATLLWKTDTFGSI